MNSLLKENLCEKLARKIIEFDSIEELIAKVSYFNQMIGAAPNKWVNDLETKFIVFSIEVKNVSPWIKDRLRYNAAKLCLDSVLEGFANVKKCNELGRGQMGVDFDFVKKILQKYSNFGGKCQS